ncbi:hypothetical protein GGI07_003245 [Coemansia sp. Benny D115]|nr:hypothetical protein GGI07_003245 [Coemansia sp. Benny D115]
MATLQRHRQLLWRRLSTTLQPPFLSTAINTPFSGGLPNSIRRRTQHLVHTVCDNGGDMLLPDKVGACKDGDHLKVQKLKTNNPWNYLVPLIDHPKLQGSVSLEDLYKLIEILQNYKKISYSSFESLLYVWANGLPNSPKRALGEDGVVQDEDADTPTELDIDVQIVTAHLAMLRVKCELVRGRHRSKNPINQNSRLMERRKVRVAVANHAHVYNCFGAELCFLIDPYNAHKKRLLMDEQISQLCSTINEHGSFRNTILLCKAVFDRVIRTQLDTKGTTRNFYTALWNSNSLNDAVEGLQRIVQGRSPGESANVDKQITYFALQLMQSARKTDLPNVMFSIYSMCKPWIRDSTEALNILLYMYAEACDMERVCYILHTMRKEGASPDAYTWTTIINGLCTSGRVESACKLFAMHLYFLPKNTGDASADDSDTQFLFAPQGGFENADPNLWERWLEEASPQYAVNPYIEGCIQDLAFEYHQQNSTRKFKRHASSQEHVFSSPPVVTPWLPSLATHRIMIKHLGRAGKTAEVIEYYKLLKQYWPQYREWAFVGTSNRTENPLTLDKFNSIERLLHGELTKSVPEFRAMFKLEPVDYDILSAAPPDHQYYFAHHKALFEMASTMPDFDLSKRNNSSKIERVMFNKSLSEYAKDGNIALMLHYMKQYPGLQDKATWTDVVRCICEQLVANNTDPDFTHPKGFCPRLIVRKNTLSPPDWIDFLFELCLLLAQKRNIHFTQVTFGIIIMTLIKLNDNAGIMRVIYFMDTYTLERLNTEMLTMIIRMSIPYSNKCELIESTLNQHIQVKDKRKTVAAEVTHVHPDQKLLTAFVHMADHPDCLPYVKRIVDLFAERYGIFLITINYHHLINLCRTFGCQPELQFWEEHQKETRAKVNTLFME